MPKVQYEIKVKDLVDPDSMINTFPRSTLYSWGFDPDGAFAWYDDLARDVRVIMQWREDES